MTFDNEAKEPEQFNSGLPQGSPLSPIFFVIYAGALEENRTMHPNEQVTTYIDDEVLIQGAKSQKFASAELQRRLNQRAERGKAMNIPSKSDLIHIIPHSSGRRHNQDTQGITLDGHQTPPTESMKRLGVWLDHHLSFKYHLAFTASRTRNSTYSLGRITQRKGVTPGSIHQIAHSLTIPTMLWGAEFWWTGAAHILSQLGPMYNNIARVVTGLPKWTPLPALLMEAGMPPLNLLLDYTTQRYGVRTLLADDTHLCKKILLERINTQRTPTHGTGFQRVANLLRELTTQDTPLEDTSHHGLPVMEAPDIGQQEKAKEAAAHQEWTKSLPDGTKSDRHKTLSA